MFWLYTIVYKVVFKHKKRFKVLLHNKKNSFITILFLLFFLPPSLASVTAEKTPTDVYYEVQLLVEEMKHLRKTNNITTPWPLFESSEVRAPRHVFQKTLEILSKLNRYRVNVLNSGAIAESRFPGRDISPNEVFSVVVRLREELSVLIPSKNMKNIELVRDGKIKSPSDVYIALSEVSIALDEALGLRGITPSEVYKRSLEIIERVKFLRASQGLSLNIPKPIKRQGKLSNHALQSVHRLLTKIRTVEQNLWIDPITLSPVPRRVITPGDVYDAIGVVSAELQSIQFRLGLEREFASLPLQHNKTPDDVINMLEWAKNMLPLFKLGTPIQQYNRLTLAKTPNEVFSVTEHILQELQSYRYLRGIRGKIREVKEIKGLKPQHVYAKGLEILGKVNILRQKQQIGIMAVPNYPLRKITPTEVFDLSLRLDEELTILYNTIDMKSSLWITAESISEYTEKQPSDVFYNMQKISNTLDLILGTEGYSSDDVYKIVLSIEQDIKLIAKKVGVSINDKRLFDKIEVDPRTEPKDVLIYSQKVLSLIYKVKKRAGMFDFTKIELLSHDKITPTDVFNQVGLIHTELIDLKIFFKISKNSEILAFQSQKSPADVLYLLKCMAKTLQEILHIEGSTL